MKRADSKTAEFTEPGLRVCHGDEQAPSFDHWAAAVIKDGALDSDHTAPRLFRRCLNSVGALRQQDGLRVTKVEPTGYHSLTKGSRRGPGTDMIEYRSGQSPMQPTGVAPMFGLRFKTCDCGGFDQFYLGPQRPQDPVDLDQRGINIAHDAVERNRMYDRKSPIVKKAKLPHTTNRIMP